MAWDEINKVDWVNDWKKLHISSPEDAELKAALGRNSATRQDELEEFAFLNEQIEWRRQRFDEKDISLNLETRIERKITDQKRIDVMDEAYEALCAKNYATEPFTLKIAAEQDAASKKNLEQAEAALAAKNTDGSEVPLDTQNSDDDEKPDFDIYLRESARIMADWIELESAQQPTVTKTKRAATATQTL